MLPAKLTTSVMRELVRHRIATSREIVATLLERIDARQDLHAFIAVVNDIPDGAGFRGPLAGLPLAVKDNIDTVDLPTSGGTPALRGCRPAADAPTVAAARRAGALVLGKTNLDELAFGTTSHNTGFGVVANPRAPGRSAGGSSGGSAAAVAAGLAPVALATDTAGSARIPAAYCGVVGFRPTTGRWGNDGTIPLSTTRDTVGVIANTVADVSLIDTVVTGQPPLPATDLKGLRLGVPRDGFYADLHPLVAAHTEAALVRLADAGAALVEVSVAGAHELDVQCGLPMVLHEVHRALPGYLAALPAPFSMLTLADVVDQVSTPDVKAILDAVLAWPITEATYRRCLQARDRLRTAYLRAFGDSGIAALVYPTVPLLAPPISDTTTTSHNGRDVDVFLTSIQNTDPGSVAGMPSITVPNGATEAGVPVGLSLEATPRGDRRLLAIAVAVEDVLA
ncbi:indoleacetamide hydrolase [Dactylosporangium darangshiense]|uniref:Indoleacetamide hydrolase n=1 Tax=Dactylosporangium darangshiense TaxID=579108 RepID=A0ABP8DNR1_9ACTN